MTDDSSVQGQPPEHSNAAVCQDLFISPKTLERHIGNIFTKLDLEVGDDVNRRVAAVIAWLRRH